MYEEFDAARADKELLLVPYTLRYIYLRRRNVLDFLAIQRALQESGVKLYGCAVAGAFVVVEDHEAAPRDPRRPASAQQQRRCVRKGRLVIAAEGPDNDQRLVLWEAWDPSLQGRALQSTTCPGLVAVPLSCLCDLRSEEADPDEEDGAGGQQQGQGLAQEKDFLTDDDWDDIVCELCLMHRRNNAGPSHGARLLAHWLIATAETLSRLRRVRHLVITCEADRLAAVSLEDDPHLYDTVQHNRSMLARQLVDTHWTNGDRQNIEDELAEHNDMLYNMQAERWAERLGQLVDRPFPQLQHGTSLSSHRLLVVSTGSLEEASRSMSRDPERVKRELAILDSLQPVRAKRSADRQAEAQCAGARGLLPERQGAGEGSGAPAGTGAGARAASGGPQLQKDGGQGPEQQDLEEGELGGGDQGPGGSRLFARGGEAGSSGGQGAGLGAGEAGGAAGTAGGVPMAADGSEGATHAYRQASAAAAAAAGRVGGEAAGPAAALHRDVERQRQQQEQQQEPHASEHRTPAHSRDGSGSAEASVGSPVPSSSQRPSLDARSQPRHPLQGHHASHQHQGQHQDPHVQERDHQNQEHIQRQGQHRQQPSQSRDSQDEPSVWGPPPPPQHTGGPAASHSLSFPRPHLQHPGCPQLRRPGQHDDNDAVSERSALGTASGMAGGWGPAGGAHGRAGAGGAAQQGDVGNSEDGTEVGSRLRVLLVPGVTLAPKPEPVEKGAVGVVAPPPPPPPRPPPVSAGASGAERSSAGAAAVGNASALGSPGAAAETTPGAGPSPCHVKPEPQAAGPPGPVLGVHSGMSPTSTPDPTRSAAAATAPDGRGSHRSGRSSNPDRDPRTARTPPATGTMPYIKPEPVGEQGRPGPAPGLVQGSPVSHAGNTASANANAAAAVAFAAAATATAAAAAAEGIRPGPSGGTAPPPQAAAPVKAEHHSDAGAGDARPGPQLPPRGSAPGAQGMQAGPQEQQQGGGARAARRVGGGWTRVGAVNLGGRGSSDGGGGSAGGADAGGSAALKTVDGYNAAGRNEVQQEQGQGQAQGRGQGQAQAQVVPKQEPDATNAHGTAGARRTGRGLQINIPRAAPGRQSSGRGGVGGGTWGADQSLPPLGPSPEPSPAVAGTPGASPPAAASTPVAPDAATGAVGAASPLHVAAGLEPAGVAAGVAAGPLAGPGEHQPPHAAPQRPPGPGAHAVARLQVPTGAPPAAVPGHVAKQEQLGDGAAPGPVGAPPGHAGGSGPRGDPRLLLGRRDPRVKVEVGQGAAAGPAAGLRPAQQQPSQLAVGAAPPAAPAPAASDVTTAVSPAGASLAGRPHAGTAAAAAAAAGHAAPASSTSIAEASLAQSAGARTAPARAPPTGAALVAHHPTTSTATTTASPAGHAGAQPPQPPPPPEQPQQRQYVRTQHQQQPHAEGAPGLSSPARASCTSPAPTGGAGPSAPPAPPSPIGAAAAQSTIAPPPPPAPPLVLPAHTAPATPPPPPRPAAGHAPAVPRHSQLSLPPPPPCDPLAEPPQHLQRTAGLAASLRAHQQQQPASQHVPQYAARRQPSQPASETVGDPYDTEPSGSVQLGKRRYDGGDGGSRGKYTSGRGMDYGRGNGSGSGNGHGHGSSSGSSRDHGYRDARERDARQARGYGRMSRSRSRSRSPERRGGRDRHGGRDGGYRGYESGEGGLAAGYHDSRTWARGQRGGWGSREREQQQRQGESGGRDGGSMNSSGARQQAGSRAGASAAGQVGRPPADYDRIAKMAQEYVVSGGVSQAQKTRRYETAAVLHVLRTGAEQAPLADVISKVPMPREVRQMHGNEREYWSGESSLASLQTGANGEQLLMLHKDWRDELA